MVRYSEVIERLERIMPFEHRNECHLWMDRSCGNKHTDLLDYAERIVESHFGDETKKAELEFFENQMAESYREYMRMAGLNQIEMRREALAQELRLNAEIQKRTLSRQAGYRVN